MHRREVLIGLASIMTAGCDVGRTSRLFRDPQAEAEARLAEYLANPEKAAKDFAEFSASITRLIGPLKRFAREQWGDGDAETPGTKRYVKYTSDYRNRVIVDFDLQRLRVEIIDNIQPYQSLEDALVTALLTPEDPASVDIFSANAVKLGGQPYLFDLIHDSRGQAIGNQQQARAFARQIVVRSIKSRVLKNGRRVYFIDLPLRQKSRTIQATKFSDIISINARRFGVDRALILAIIEVESAFNPFAVSRAPAFGLMQLVPSTGGRDAMRFVYQQDRDPTPNELFRSDRNVELGTAYFHMLTNQYLNKISNPLSRIYASIAAYNGGASNVFKVYGGKPNAAMRSINTRSAEQVYRDLTQKHGFEETRNYLRKVVDAWHRYRGMK